MKKRAAGVFAFRTVCVTIATCIALVVTGNIGVAQNGPEHPDDDEFQDPSLTPIPDPTRIDDDEWSDPT